MSGRADGGPGYSGLEQLQAEDFLPFAFLQRALDEIDGLLYSDHVVGSG